MLLWVSGLKRGVNKFVSFGSMFGLFMDVWVGEE